jgi:acyl dehydratase
VAESTASRTVSGEFGALGLLRAALPAVPVVGSLPGIRKTGGDFAGLGVSRPPVTVERDHVERYAEVCGFPVKDTVPLPYPHMLAFPLHMALMTDPAFPTPAMGMVHIENSITARRPIAIGESLVAGVWVGRPLPHPAGTAYRFTTTVTSGDGETVWEEASTYLRRGRRDPDAVWTSTFEDVAPSGPVWPLKADLGRQYARVSGDYNPIHLTSLSAKALGFPRQIAHGMWTKARCIAAMENRLPDAVTVEVAFKKPVFLPSSVAFGSRKEGDGYAFSLTKRGSETVHLLGRATPA